MSRANLYVRLPSGEIRHGIYNGTSDVACDRLYDDADEAWEAWFDGTASDYQYEEGGGEPVIVATDYGGGWAWEATATHTHLTSKHEPWPYDGDAVEQLPLPEWAR